MLKIRPQRLLFLISAFLGSIPFPAFAAGGYALVWGGSCNWNHADLESKMVSAANTLSARQWNVSVGYSENESDIAAKLSPYKGTLADGSKKTLMDFLDNVQKNAKPGDEVLIVVAAHGDVETAGKTHAWLLPGCDEMPVDDADLQSHLNQLKEKGIKIAVADGSCYGGYSVQHLQNYGCVLTDQGDTESIGMDFVNNMAKDAANQPAPVSLETIFRDMLTNQPKLHYAEIVEPQLSGFTNSFQASSDDAKSVTDQYNLAGDSYGGGRNSCDAVSAMKDFNTFVTGLNKLMSTDNDILSSTLKKATQTDEQNLKAQLGLQNDLLNKINATVDLLNAIPVAPVVIDLASVDPSLKHFLTNSKIPTYMAAGRDGDQDLGYQVKNGKLIIPWTISGLKSPEQTATSFLSDASMLDDSVNKALNSGPNLTQEIQKVATAAQAQSYALLSDSQKATADTNQKNVNSEFDSLYSVKMAIQNAEVRVDADVRALRVIELDRLTANPKALSPAERSHLKSCADFKI